MKLRTNWETNLYTFAGWLAFVFGSVFFALYPLYLVFRIDPFLAESGYVYYMSATFGGTALAWGVVLLKAVSKSNYRKLLSEPSALGFLLLALMRVITILFRQDVLNFITPVALRIAVSVVESVLFGGLAYGFWMVSKTLANCEH